MQSGSPRFLARRKRCGVVLGVVLGDASLAFGGSSSNSTVRCPIWWARLGLMTPRARRFVQLLLFMPYTRASRKEKSDAGNEDLSDEDTDDRVEELKAAVHVDGGESEEQDEEEQEEDEQPFWSEVLSCCILHFAPLFACRRKASVATTPTAISSARR